MNYEWLALTCFLASFGLPVLSVVAGVLFRLEIKRLAPVMWLFWAFGAANIAISATALPAESGSKQVYYAFYAIVVPIMIFPRLFQLMRQGRFANNENQQLDEQPRSKPSGASITKGGTTRSGPVCCSRLESESGATVLQTSSGEAGYVGWVCWVANWYKWRLTVNAWGDPAEVEALARAYGTFSAWHSISTKDQNAFATVTGVVTCRHLNGKCVARASGGQNKHDSGDFEAAVTIDAIPGRNPDEVQLEVQMVAAVEGQLAIKQVNLSASGGASGGGASGNVRVNTVVNVANTAKDSIDATRYYNYICEPCGEGSTSTKPGPGASSTPGTEGDEAPVCCCCVTETRIDGLRDLTTPDRVGHAFDFVIDLEYKPGQGTNDCTLEWWEETTLTAPGKVPEVEPWRDLYVTNPNAGTFQFWKAKKIPCPEGGPLTVPCPDSPSLTLQDDNGNPRTVRRITNFRLVVRSGSGCDCPNTDKEVTATQVIEIQNGVLIARSFDITS